MRREKRKQLLIFLVWLLLLWILSACNGGGTAVSGSSGIPVAPEFADFYTEFGGARIFGAPLTEAFPVDAASDSLVVQYFQSMRLNYDGAAAAGERISIYPLGEWALTAVPDSATVPVATNGRSRSFSDTGYSIHGEFLTFYEDYDGERLFGSPLSPQMREGDLIVQYFRNARLEWRPELPPMHQVQVSLLGLAHFNEEMVFTYQKHVNARPIVATSAPEANVRTAAVTADVQFPILYAGETQVLYVTVQHEDGRPVAAVNVDLTITTATVQDTISLAETDAAGRIQMPLDLSGIPPGEQVQLTITVTDGNGRVLGRDMIEFNTWW